MDETDPRIKLIREVRKLGNQWEATATSSAMNAVRKRGKAELDDAGYWVAKHDTANDMADKMIILINTYWPPSGCVGLEK